MALSSADRRKWLYVTLASVGLSAACTFGIGLVVHMKEQRDVAQFRQLSPVEAEQEIKMIIKKMGPLYAWDFVKRVYMINGVVVFGNADGHAIAHYVGEGMYKRYGLAQGLRECDHALAEGCMHGVVEEMIHEHGTDAPEEMGQVCMGQTDSSSCAHGAGHGIADATGRDQNESMRWCRRFPSAIAPDCAEGALMDVTWGRNRKETERSPWAICEPVDDAFKVACASAVGNYFAESHDGEGGEFYRYEPATASDACDSAPSPDMKDRCFMRIGQSIVRRAKADPASMYALCTQLNDDRINQCIVTANKFVEDQHIF